jgi:hypothetical protein
MGFAQDHINGGKSMKRYMPIVLLLAFAGVAWISPAHAQTDAEDFYRPWVDYRDGEISIDFDRTPISFALHAIQVKTGFQIVVPSTSDTKLVNLKLARQPLEPAVRSLILNIGYKNFAMLYDEQGRPRRVVILSARVEAEKEGSTTVKTEPPAKLTEEERDNLKKTLERWSELKQEERGRIEDRLKSLPESEEREQLVKLYGRQLLGLSKPN